MVKNAVVRCTCPRSLLGRLGDDCDRIAPEACPSFRVRVSIKVTDREFELEVLRSARAIDMQVLEACGMVRAKVCFGLLHGHAEVGNYGKREGLLADGREGGTENANDRGRTEEPRAGEDVGGGREMSD